MKKYNEEGRNRWKLSRQGTNPEEYNAARKAQGDRCAICGDKSKGQRLSVDHDHKTMKFRGLLCDLCNKALGMLKDDPVRACKLADYLFKHQSGS
jgi:hypothetical protein